MKNILIINLGTSKDIITSSHLISSHKAEEQNVNITLLVFKENENIAKSIEHVSHVATIDSAKITSLIENPLFSDAVAINQFSSDLVEISAQTWSTIINYSNNTISSYLIKSFEAENIIGTYIDNLGVAKTSNEWSTYQNSVASKLNRLAITIPSIRNHMTLTPIHQDVEKIKIDPEFLFVSNQNFNRIRSMNGKEAKYIVGINLEVGYDGCALSENTITEVLETIDESKDFKAVLLTSGKSYQKELVNRLNAKFNNELISINVDSIALSAVLSNIDLLISTANDQLAIADCLEVRAIEIKDNTASNKNPTVLFEGNHIIYSANETSLASDILLCMNEAFESELPITFLNSENPVSLAVTDNYGVFYTQVRGNISLQEEIDYHIKRSVHFEILGYPRNNELMTHLKSNLPEEEIMTYINTSREEITNVTRSLLATIKCLKEVNTQGGLERFIRNLDHLIKFAQTDNLSGSIAMMFEGRVENITSTDPKENINEIEKLLFTFKSDVQIFTNTLATLIESERSKDADSQIVAEVNN